jgi:hypothetical protein
MEFIRAFPGNNAEMVCLFYKIKVLDPLHSKRQPRASGIATVSASSTESATAETSAAKAASSKGAAGPAAKTPGAPGAEIRETPLSLRA